MVGLIMINIEYIDKLNERELLSMNDKFNKFAFENELKCNHTKFIFTAKKENEIVGIITGHEGYVNDN